MPTLHDLSALGDYALAAAIIIGAIIMSAALDRLNTSTTTLSTSVDTLIASAPPSDEAGINAAADALDAINAKVVAATPVT